MGFSLNNQTSQMNGNSPSEGVRPFQPNSPSEPVVQSSLIGSSNNRPSGKGGSSFTYSPTSGQRQMGSPNPYPNTVGQWDNASIQPVQRSGKGKGF